MAKRIGRAPRRTQEQRRTETIGKLLDAATEALIELGYGGASVQEICRRAGVSQGGLFRHFPTREALMVAAGERIGERLLERYRREFEALSREEEPVLVALRLVREHCRSRINQAWFELECASRSSPTLRQALKPSALRYHQSIEALARALLPDLAGSLGEAFPVLVDTIISLYDGDTLHRFVAKRPGLDDARTALLARLFAPLVVAR